MFLREGGKVVCYSPILSDLRSKVSALMGDHQGRPTSAFHLP